MAAERFIVEISMEYQVEDQEALMTAVPHVDDRPNGEFSDRVAHLLQAKFEEHAFDVEGVRAIGISLTLDG